MTSDRPKLGGIFGSIPDRTADLAGILGAPAESPPAAEAPAGTETRGEPSETQPDTTSVTSPRPTGRVTRPARTVQPRSEQPRVAAKSESAGNKVVPVVLDASLLQDLREFAARTEQTQGSVALRAIEANADELAGHWCTPPATSGPGRLFGPHSSLRRRAEPGVQTQLRISVPDAETLDQLATQWDAPSRSALVNEALRRYVRASAT